MKTQPRLSVTNLNGHRRVAPATPNKPAASSHPAVSASLRVPVTRENWALLRFLRDAELEAWNSVPPFATEPAPAEALASQPATLRAHVLDSLKHNRNESVFLGAVAAVAAGALTWGLLDSVSLVQHWSGFVQFMRTLVG